MARYRHYRNFGKEGEVVFATTTCLDFAHLLRRPEMKDRMVERLRDDHAYYGAALFAYVVMSNHIHLISRVPVGRTSSWFLQRLKANSSKELLPLLTLGEQSELDAQRGLDSRQFWKRSFDSLVLRDEDTFWQKVRYIHENPLRAGLVARPEEYRWSSAAIFSEGGFDRERGLVALV